MYQQIFGYVNKEFLNKMIAIYSYFNAVKSFFAKNKSNTLFTASAVAVVSTFLNYNNNFNENKTLMFKHVDYVYQKTEENLKYTRQLIESEKTFFKTMCTYYESISDDDCSPNKFDLE